MIDWLKVLNTKSGNVLRKKICGLVDAVANKRMEEFWKNRELKFTFVEKSLPQEALKIWIPFFYFW